MKVEIYLFGGVDVDFEKVIIFLGGLIVFEGKMCFMLVYEESQGELVSYML